MRESLLLSIIAWAWLGTGCAPKHPVVGLEREARRYDRTFDKAAAATTNDDSYFASLPDARAAAVEFLGTGAQTPEVEDKRVGSDWSYTGETGVDQASEYYSEQRSRRIVTFTSIGAELSVSGSSASERRVLRPQGKSGAWTPETAPLDVTPLRTQLQRLEDSYLVRIMNGSSRKALLDDFARSLPSGFTVTARDEHSLTAARVATKRKERERQGWWASWDARVLLTARLEESGEVSVTSLLEHRFTTDSEIGPWQPAGTHNPSLATDWLASTLRVAIPAGHAQYGAPLLEAVSLRREPLTPPPEPPRLRTMDEIATVIRQRAYELRKGNFQVCIDHILVNPTDSSGYDWDLPGVTEMLGATQTVAEGVDGAMGEINRVADNTQVVGAAVDMGIAYLTGSTIDRRQLQSIANVTGRVAGWTQAHLPVKPDIAGGVAIGPNSYPLSEYADTLRADPELCGGVVFSPGRGAVALDLWDVDLDENDPIGRCTLTPDDIIARGITGIPCGFARIYISADHQFSFGQIAVVGLPPAQ